jgi:hypothetical protein
MTVDDVIEVLDRLAIAGVEIWWRPMFRVIGPGRSSAVC